MDASINSIRNNTRIIIRELGLLKTDFHEDEIPPAQAHLLIELHTAHKLSLQAICERLNLDRKSLHRLIDGLLEKNWIRIIRDDFDHRKKDVQITLEGESAYEILNKDTNALVKRALRTLGEQEQQAVLMGLSSYAAALQKASHRNYHLRPIEKKDDPMMAKIIRSSLEEFGAVGPGSPAQDPTLDYLSQAFSTSQSAYYVIERDHHILGGGGFGPLKKGPEDVCEFKRFYFMPDLRGLGLGGTLMTTLLNQAAKVGYKQCYLETLKAMIFANKLYQRMGFQMLNSPLGNTGMVCTDVWYIKNLAA